MEVASQSYIGISPKLYSFLRHPIQLYTRTHIPIMSPPYITVQGAYALGLSTQAVYTRVGRLLYQKRVGNFTANPVLLQSWWHYGSNN